jgi:hypothetical protein
VRGRFFGFLLLGRGEVLAMWLRIGEEGESVRWTENPTAVPRAMGRRIDAAGFWKTSAGSVMEGM